MKKILFWMFLILYYNSVVSQNSSELPELRIEKETANNYIVYRIPDYGFVGRDGCMVLEEISMDIFALNQKSIRGKIFNSKTKEPLSGAQIHLFITQNGTIQEIVISAGPDGLYKSGYNGQLNKMYVEHFGHRNLKIDFERK